MIVPDRFHLFSTLVIVGLVHRLIVVDCVTTVDDDDESLASTIDAAAEALQKCVQYPGLTVAVVRVADDKSTAKQRTLIRNYGVRDNAGPAMVDDDTRFCIGSVTKTFTAALLAQLLHDNQTFSLDTPVRNLLGPDFELCDEERTTQTNVRDLLAHRVGVAKHFGAFLLGYNFTRANIVRRVRHLPSVKPFRASRIFNNFMYVIAGQLAERMNGTWWENQITWKFLNRLQMKRTTFADRVGDWNFGFALPHALDDGKVIPLRAKVTGNVLRPVGPAGSICATAKDMSAWILMLLQNGTDARGHPVLTPSVVRELFKVHNPFSKPQKRLRAPTTTEDVHWTSRGYGLGWIIGAYRNRTRAFHSGFSNYYHSIVSLLPDDGIGIFTALNGPHIVKCDNGMKALHMYISDLLLGQPSRLSPSNICSYPRVEATKDADPTTTQQTMTASPEEVTSTLSSDSESSTSSTPTSTDGTISSSEDDLDMTEEMSTTSAASSSSHATTTAQKTSSSSSSSSSFGLDFETTEETSTTSSTSSSAPTTTKMSFGSKLRANVVRRRLSARPSRRRRPSRDVVNEKILSFLRPFVGTYANPFFGDVVINVNLTAPALQFNYGYYGKALLEPVSTAREPIVFRLRFFSSIWYQSESDDMKRFAKLGMFDVQFGKAANSSSFIIDKLVVFLFDTQKPPIFSRV